MSIDFEDIENGTKPFIKCSVCGGYGYHFPAGQTGAKRCPSCLGDGRSRKPRH